MYLIKIAVLVVAYLLGSIPTALIISKRFRGVDIRTLGDANMGATNVSRTLGQKLGITVGVLDFLKGTLSVLLAYALGFELGWQMLTGICAILGHDFPIFARFKGGQGTATSAGTMLVLFPAQALPGLVLYGLLFLIIRKSPISASIGGGFTALLLGLAHHWVLLAYAVGAFAFIPFKIFLDSHRRKALEAARVKEASQM